MKCVRDENGEVLVMDNEVQDRWRRHFERLMNEGADLAEQEEAEGEEELGVEQVSVEEVARALRGMKAGKAVGPDEISVEVWKIVGKNLLLGSSVCSTKMLAGEKMPSECR